MSKPEDCAVCKWVGYCGEEYEYHCDLRRSIVMEFAEKLGLAKILNNWFINPKPCVFYVESTKTVEEIKQTGLGR